jgi:hypothetical protein
VEEDVQGIFALAGRRCFSAGEIVGEHHSVEQIGDDFGDLLTGRSRTVPADHRGTSLATGPCSPRDARNRWAFSVAV